MEKTAAGDALRRYRSRVEAALARVLEGDLPERLYEAMRYATLGGGKRLRASLVYAAGEALGAPLEQLDAPACAVELIHAYSLVHDDLPAMDDDALRRGKPTCHKAFDEATALLAGDALQTRAFEVLAGADMIPCEQRTAMLLALARAAGVDGMAGGQAIDLAVVGRRLTLSQLQDMHERKTGALIRASVRLGALAGAARQAQLDALDAYARALGLAFQIVDDVLDVEGETAVLGKAQGADAARGKPTYPSVLGLAEAKARARTLHGEALASLGTLKHNGIILACLADYVIDRTN